VKANLSYRRRRRLRSGLKTECADARIKRQAVAGGGAFRRCKVDCPLADRARWALGIRHWPRVCVARVRINRTSSGEGGRGAAAGATTSPSPTLTIGAPLGGNSNGHWEVASGGDYYGEPSAASGLCQGRDRHHSVPTSNQNWEEVFDILIEQAHATVGRPGDADRMGGSMETDGDAALHLRCAGR